MSRASIYTAAEDDMILDVDRPAADIAAEIGVTPRHVHRRRRYLLHEQGQEKPCAAPVVRHEVTTIEAVREMRAGGDSYRLIAAALGVSRSCAAGLVSRHCQDIPSTRSIGRSAGCVEKAPKVAKAKAVAVATVPKPTAVPVAPPVLTIVTSPVPFAAARGCRWPLWSTSDALTDKTVCGAACGTDTYCAGHAALAYRVPEKRRAA